MTTISDPAVTTDRRGLRVLDLDECRARLGRARVGRLAFVSAGDPVILPVNAALDGDDIVFRTQGGAKMETAVVGGRAAYEVDGYDLVAETGWSVVVRGAVDLVYDAAVVARYDGLGLHSWADPESHGQWLRLRPDEVSGREIVH